ncbi:MAG: thioesterase family protein [Cumulibacter sp.]
MSHPTLDAEAYYLPTGDNRYRPTEATTSPWNDAAQHGGPPSALLARVMSDLVDPSLRLGRLAVDFPGPIPRTEFTIDAKITRPGRRVCRTEAAMIVDNKVVASASAWHIATGERPPTDGVHDFAAPALPDAQPQRFFPGMDDWGHGRSVEWRFTHGALAESGPAGVWTRLRQPLIAGRDLTGFDRAIVVADSANGVSNELPFGEWLYIPPTMTFTALRAPVGEWVYLDAQTSLADDGVGIASGSLGDAEGLCGLVAQPLLVTAV